MRVLIAISSWVGAATNGDNQAQRDTFLGDLSRFSGVEYRFFIGDGTPHGEDETAMLASLDTDLAYKAKALANLSARASDAPFTYVPKADEVILPVPDDYLHLPYKVRGQCRWTLERGFDFMYQSGTDIYTDLGRLLTSGFENHDYTGRICSWPTPGIDGPLILGGGYCLSKRALQFLVNEPIHKWAEDQWVASSLNKNGVVPHGDGRFYAEYLRHGTCPRPDNDFISAHLGPDVLWPESYNSRTMYEVHAKRYPK